MEESIVSWFILFACSIAGCVVLIRAAVKELESRKNEYY